MFFLCLKKKKNYLRLGQKEGPMMFEDHMRSQAKRDIQRLFFVTGCQHRPLYPHKIPQSTEDVAHTDAGRGWTPYHLRQSTSAVSKWIMSSHNHDVFLVKFIHCLQKVNITQKCLWLEIRPGERSTSPLTNVQWRDSGVVMRDSSRINDVTK